MLTGYRFGLNNIGVLRSLFYTHNEFVNIWSDLIAAIGFSGWGAYMVYRSLLWRIKTGMRCGCDVIFFVSCFGVYHVFLLDIVEVPIYECVDCMCVNACM